MKANKLIVRALILLGFGGAVGLTACGTNRAQKSRQTEKSTEKSTETTAPTADSTNTWQPQGEPIRVLYGVPPSQYNLDGPVRGERPKPFETPSRGSNVQAGDRAE
jgi:hypothetical protein